MARIRNGILGHDYEFEIALQLIGEVTISFPILLLVFDTTADVFPYSDAAFESRYSIVSELAR